MQMSSKNKEGELCKVRDIALCQLLMVAGTTPVVGADLFYLGKTLFYHGKSHDSLIPDILLGPYKTMTQEYIPVAHCAVPMCLNYSHIYKALKTTV